MTPEFRTLEGKEYDAEKVRSMLKFCAVNADDAKTAGFINGLAEYLNRKGYLSPKQMSVLVEIYDQSGTEEF